MKIEPRDRSRRRFLRLSGIAAGTLLTGGVLQACSTTLPAAPAASTATSKPAVVPKLLVSYGSPVGSFAALWMAKAIDAFDKYGVSVDVQYIETATAVPAMVSNSIDVEEVSAAPIITADANGDLDLVMIASTLNHPILGLYTVPEITSADQLRGKVVATDKPGTPTDYVARLSLSLLGLKPSDVELRIVGNTSEVTPVMLSGQVPAGVVAPPQSFLVEAKGFHLLQDIFNQPYQNVAVVARRSRLDELAAGLRPLLASVRDGILAFRSQPELAMSVLGEYSKIEDPVVLKKTYEFYTTKAPFEPSLQPTMAGIKAMMDFLSSSVPKLANYTPEQFVDTRFVSQLPT